MSSRRTVAVLVLSLVASLLAFAVPAVAQTAATICEVQGSGPRSPFAPPEGNGFGEEVTTTGIVYATEPDGFYMQDPDCDGDPATSDGIYVFTNTSDTEFPRHPIPALGDEVEVRASVVEFFFSTQLSGSDTRFSDVTVISSGNPVPEPTAIDPAQALAQGPDRAYYESLEHMRVSLATGQTWAGTNKFGETFLVPDMVSERIRRTDERYDLLALLDDVDGGGDVFAFAFDTVTGSTGPLAFTFNQYKLLVEDIDAVTVTPSGDDRPAEITQQPLGSTPFATFNMENVFGNIEPGNPQPGIPDLNVPEPTIEEIELKEDKLARAIVEELGHPDVLGVQEVANKTLLDRIAAESNALLEEAGLPGSYEAIYLEGNDIRYIGVGYLVDVEAVSYDNVRQFDKEAVSDGRCDAGASGTLVHDRVPLAIDVTGVDGTTSTVVVNHFKSKFGGNEENEFFEPCRVEQAESVVANIDGLTNVVILGDLNAFRDEPTLGVFEAAGFTNTVNLIPEDRRFSFVFEGRVQFLDHILVDDSLLDEVIAADSSKLVNDVPVPLFEDDASTGLGASDHDPVVTFLGPITFRLAGEGNVAEAIALSEATFPDGSGTALIGRSDLFPDSLASGSLQGLFDAPLLLNSSDALDGAVADELQRLGAGAVFLLGGEEALSAGVAEQLQEAGYSVDRYEGPTRIETAIDIAELAFAETDTIYLARAYSTNGDPTQAFADSLALGGWAADTQTPVLLTESNLLSTTTAAYLDGSAVATVRVIGGTDAVSAQVVADLEASGLEVERVFGTTRFETAVEIAEARGAAGAAAAERVILADGIGIDAWASGFAAAAHSARFDAPILLSAGEELPATTGTWLDTAPTTDLVCAPSVTEAACAAAEQQMR